jgi:hypothetical protein
MTLCDGKSFYMVNAMPYTGRVEKSADKFVPAYYIRTLTEPIHGTKRNGLLPYRWLKVYFQTISYPLWIRLEKTRERYHKASHHPEESRYSHASMHIMDHRP